MFLYIKNAVTRSKAVLRRKFRIKNCFVRMRQNLASDCLAWLNYTSKSPKSPKVLKATEPIQPAKISNRRASVAGSNLYSVTDRVEERGFDYLSRVPRSSSNPVSLDLGIVDGPNCVAGIQNMSIRNNFDPFRRGNSIPFALKGRKRSKSIENMWRPSLDTIFESRSGKFDVYYLFPYMKFDK